MLEEGKRHRYAVFGAGYTEGDEGVLFQDAPPLYLSDCPGHPGRPR